MQCERRNKHIDTNLKLYVSAKQSFSRFSTDSQVARALCVSFSDGLLFENISASCGPSACFDSFDDNPNICFGGIVLWKQVGALNGVINLYKIVDKPDYVMEKSAFLEANSAGVTAQTAGPEFPCAAAPDGQAKVLKHYKLIGTKLGDLNPFLHHEDYEAMPGAGCLLPASARAGLQFSSVSVASKDRSCARRCGATRPWCSESRCNHVVRL